MNDSQYFVKFKFADEQIKRYFENALKDLKIAEKTDIPEVKFSYSYNALLKAGITLVATKKSLKVRSIPGHHMKILQAMGEILKDTSIFDVCNSMRMKRNLDLYEGGIVISEKESRDYFNFAKEVIEKVKNHLRRTR